MKFKSFLPLLALSILLVGCGDTHNDSSSSESGGGENSSSIDSSSSLEATVLVRFFKSYSYGDIEIGYDENNGDDPYHLEDAYDYYYAVPGSLFVEPETPTTPDDPAFPYFIGWSEKPIVDSESDLIDFTSDTVPNRELYTLYGIWVSEQPTN